MFRENNWAKLSPAHRRIPSVQCPPNFEAQSSTMLEKKKKKKKKKEESLAHPFVYIQIEGLSMIMEL
uniref:Uncharacterized protein n=1 Tax=Cucumis melo TaxID=3656 RepID=A0A9I9EC06_CUCME